MNVSKTLALFTAVFLLTSWALIFAEESKVDIQKFEGRTEAVVSSKEKHKVNMNVRWFEKPFVWSGNFLVETAQISSKTVGMITDKTVYAVQTGTGFLLSPIFKAIDLKRWKESGPEKK